MHLNTENNCILYVFTLKSPRPTEKRRLNGKVLDILDHIDYPAVILFPLEFL